MQHGMVSLSPHQHQRLDELTPRERVIIRHVACGFPSRYIANLESVEVRTVRSQLEMIYNKLGIAGRTQLAVYALLAGLVRPEEIVSAWREHMPEILG